MHHQRPILSELRLQRFHRWVLLWLRWFVAFLDAAEDFAPLTREASAIAHGWLDGIERIVTSLIIIHAAPHVRPIKAPRHSAHRRNDTALQRAIIGSALRRKLRAKDLRQRIAALSQNVAPLVASLLKRAPRGLTRRRPILVRREGRAAEPTFAFAFPALGADTS